MQSPGVLPTEPAGAPTLGSPGSGPEPPAEGDSPVAIRAAIAEETQAVLA